MAAKKYLALIAGRLSEVLGLQVSTGAADAGKVVALDDTGKLDVSMLPTGIGADTVVLPASEALVAGDFVNLWSNGGVANARKADASTSGKEADGFVLANVANAANATVYLKGVNTQLTGLTPGTRYFLSAAAPGTVTATAPAAANQVVQAVGKSTGATELAMRLEDGVILA